MAKQRGDVVLVDDDQAFREFLRDTLERAGYTTSDFASAEEARPAIEEHRPAVVVADVHLPGISGYELCREAKERYKGLPVVLVSGERTEPYDRAAGILLGADDYLVKPVDGGELVARLWRLVGSPRPMQHTTSGAVGDKLATLTPREHEVLELLADGSSQDEISEALFISPKTVATHIQHILTKLGVRSRTQAVAMALKHERAVAAASQASDVRSKT